ncbi:MAG: AMP-binding protein [Firmicutes bacterium]|nr:AMP-binding protein [Bacillota bacterium]
MNDLKLIAERIKYLRDIFGLSQPAMAEVAGVSLEEYALYEEGKADFTFSFLQKLAKFYSVDIVEIISGGSPKLSGFQVMRAGEGMPFERRKGFSYLHKASKFKNKLAEPFVVTAPFNASIKELSLSAHNDDELNFILKGSLRFKIGDYETVLNEGDSVYYNALVPHGMSATNGKECTFLSVVVKKDLADNGIATVIGADEVKKIKDKTAIYRKFVIPEENEKGNLTKISFDIPTNFNFAYDVVDALAKKCPDKPAMLWVGADKNEKVFTFADMKRLSDKCANFFLSEGIKKGDKVMLVLKRYHQFWPAILALHKIGAIAIPATHLLTKKDYLYRFESAGVNHVVITSDGDATAECEEAGKEYKKIDKKFIVGADRKGWINFDSGLESASESLNRINNFADDLMLMYFTSGTTGYPKITAHSYKYPLGHLITAKYWQNVDPDGCHFTVADTGWAKSVWGKLYGQWLCEACVFTYNMEKFVPQDLLEMFARYNITTFCAPPTMYRFFIKEDLSKYDLSSLKHCCIAGEALNPEVYEQWQKATGLKLMEGFGQTEMTVCVANQPADEPKPGSMGKPMPLYDIAIVDSDNKPVKSGEIGEIVIRTDKGVPPGMFLGYYNDETATKKAWNKNVYHTGDVAWQDEDGYIWYVGRTDDVIKSAGYRIGPFEVESVIMEIPYILECAVTGVPDEVRGQVIKATIVLKGKPPSEELKKEIQKYVKEHTAPYKYPRIIEFVDALPKTISGKIMRKDLR